MSYQGCHAPAGKFGRKIAPFRDLLHPSNLKLSRLMLAAHHFSYKALA